MCNATYDWGGKEPLECTLDEHSTTLLGEIIHLGKLRDTGYYWNDRERGATRDPEAVIRVLPTFGDRS